MRGLIQTPRPEKPRAFSGYRLPSFLESLAENTGFNPFGRRGTDLSAPQFRSALGQMTKKSSDASTAPIVSVAMCTGPVAPVPSAS
jgi:hypothetical protein